MQIFTGYKLGIFTHGFNVLKILKLRKTNYIMATMSTEVSNTNVSPKLNFYKATAEDLKILMKEWNQPAFRADQIRKSIYENGIVDFNEISNIPLNLREKLSEFFTIGSLNLISEAISKDGTRKRAYELHDGQLIESVLMPYDDGRNTACISSQAGCGMGCVFCATGQMGFARQLSSTEIFEQAQKFSAELKLENKRLSNIVFMGMGEPLANMKNVIEVIHRLNTELGIGMRHITISTVGLAPRIRQLADLDLQVGLAISLHQATNDKRSSLMPVNTRYPIEELLESIRYYISKTNRRVSFEWALIRGETDTPESARELGRLLKGILCHVNVIPLNPTDGYLGKPTQKNGVDEFIRILGDEFGITATPRTRRGIDINAGCGQLKSELLRKRGIHQTIGTKLDNSSKVDIEQLIAD